MYRREKQECDWLKSTLHSCMIGQRELPAPPTLQNTCVGSVKG